MLDWQQSTQHALQFAFRTIGTPIIKLSSINSMRGASGAGEMTPQELHGQAAMIIACVERKVDIVEMCYLKAYYGRELNHDRAVAEVLTHTVVAAMGTGVHSRRGIEKLIQNYFGGDIPITQIRRDFNCNNHYANVKRNKVYDTLTAIGARAENDADIALHSAGLLE